LFLFTCNMCAWTVLFQSVVFHLCERLNHSQRITLWLSCNLCPCVSQASSLLLMTSYVLSISLWLCVLVRLACLCACVAIKDHYNYCNVFSTFHTMNHTYCSVYLIKLFIINLSWGTFVAWSKLQWSILTAWSTTCPLLWKVRWQCHVSTHDDAGWQWGHSPNMGHMVDVCRRHGLHYTPYRDNAVHNTSKCTVIGGGIEACGKRA